MATQAGERCAQEHGFTGLPIDPFAIAEQQDIRVEAKQQAGVSGMLIFVEDKVAIMYATHLNNRGFERFSVAHELGHYFLPGHPEEIIRGGGQHVSRAGFSQGDTSIEIEADHFAAGLLMPRHLVRRLLNQYQPGLGAVVQLAEQAEVSLTAAAIRVAECAEYPVGVVVTQGEEVRYGFFSDHFKRLGKRVFLRKGDRVPSDVETWAFNQTPTNVTRGTRATCETTLGAWFDNGSNLALDEEIAGLGNFGHTLTVLSSEAIPMDPDDESEADEEDALQQSWTPRFAYGR